MINHLNEAKLTSAVLAVLIWVVTIPGCVVNAPTFENTQTRNEAAAKPVDLEAFLDGKIELDLAVSWNTPLYSKFFGFPPDDRVDGKSLADVITSKTFIRNDGKLCSTCHNKVASLGDYGVPVEVNGSNPDLGPNDEVWGKTWAGTGGWAERTAANKTKPVIIRAALKLWIQNNYEIGKSPGSKSSKED